MAASDGAPTPEGGHKETKADKAKAAAELKDKAYPLFIGIGLEENTTQCVCKDTGAWGSHGLVRSPHNGIGRRNALRNVKFTQALMDVITEAGVTGGCPKTQGNMLYTLASKVCARLVLGSCASPTAARITHSCTPCNPKMCLRTARRPGPYLAALVAQPPTR